MAEQTLLTIVQNILSAMDADEINSISDTTEASQVAQIVQNKYYDIVSSYAGFTLIINVSSTIGSGTSYSWTITAAGNAIAAPGYVYVTILPLDQFMDMMNRFNPSDLDVFSYQFKEGGNNFTFYYKNDHRPTWCTVLANQFVIFDTFDLSQDDTLQASKTLCYGQIVPPFLLTDLFVPPLNDQQFPLLLNESKMLAFLELKQMPHPIADREIRRQWSVVQKGKSIANKPSHFDQLANFGRVPRTGGYSSGGYGAYKWMRQSGP